MGASDQAACYRGFLQRVRNERQAATGTRDYYSNYFFHSSQRALED